MNIANTEYTIVVFLRKDQNKGIRQPGFGIREDRIGHQGIYILCDEKDKSGRLIYPDRYYMAREDVLNCHETVLDNGTHLRVVPILKCGVSKRG